jgi:hypothetical protein
MDDYFLRGKRIYCKDTKEKVFGYNEYLKSKHWLLLRKKYITKDTVCALCKERNSPLQLHHLNYTNLGNEKRNDLVVLCSTCHKLIHKSKSNIPKILYKK